MTAAELGALFPDAVAYDDAELTRALVAARAPQPRPLGELRRSEAFALASGGEPRELDGGYAVPPGGAALRTNPLYDAGTLRFPSERYAAEYGPLATYPATFSEPADGTARAAAIRCRALVDLPERW